MTSQSQNSKYFVMLNVVVSISGLAWSQAATVLVFRALLAEGFPVVCVALSVACLKKSSFFYRGLLELADPYTRLPKCSVAVQRST